MKKIVLLIITLFLSCLIYSEDSDLKNKSYEELWKEVDTFENDKLPKSSLKVINEIIEKSEIDKNTDQRLKAVLYKINNDSIYFENTILSIKNELNNFEFPEKNILHLMLSKFLYRYLSGDYWEISIKKNKKYNENDIDTWSLDKIQDEIISNFKLSIERKNDLKNVNIKKYDYIIEKGNSDYLRPTLFEFFVYQIVNMNSSFYFNRTSNIFNQLFLVENDSTPYFSSSDKFVELTIKNSNLVLKLLQDIEKIHYRDNNVNALIDCNLKRLKFVYSFSNNINKNKLYEKSLNSLLKKYEKSFMVSEIVYDIAQFYSPSNSYSEVQREKEAYDICTKYLNKSNGNKIGKQQLKDYIKELKNKLISIEIGKVNVPKKPFLAKVYYQNIKNISLRIVKKKEYDYFYWRDIADKIFERENIYTKDFSLPDLNDLKLHSSEIIIDGLEIGQYYILLAPNGDWKNKKLRVYTDFQVTNLALINNKIESSFSGYVVDRTTGEVIKGAKVSEITIDQKYKRIRKNYVTYSEKNGFFALKKASGRARITYKNDSYIFKFHYKDGEIDWNYRWTFLSDRNIYRPGQTIYFKGILSVNILNKCKILENTSLNLNFIDISGNIIKRFNLTTNEFGSINESFQLPLDVVNGRMEVRCFKKNMIGKSYIEIAEYKKPKIEIDFEKIDNQFTYGDKILIQGKAKTITNIGLNNEDILYKIFEENEVIKTGTTKTDTFGFFKIDFTTNKKKISNLENDIPSRFKMLKGFKNKIFFDFKKNQKSNYRTSYRIEVSITDKKGETLLKNKEFYILSKKLKVNIDFPNEIDKNENIPTINLSIKNNDNSEIKSKGVLRLFSLNAPKKALRDRKWLYPDIQMIDKNNFINKLPNDYFIDNNNIENFKVNKKVLEYNFNTEINSSLLFKEIKEFNLGNYKIEIILYDNDDNKYIENKFFTIFDSSSSKMPYKTISWFKFLNEKPKKGENINVLIGSSKLEVNILYELIYNDKIIKSGFIPINNEQKKISIPVDSEFSKYTIAFTFIKDNRIYYCLKKIDAGVNQRKLKIKTSFFRSKLIPGEKEKLKLIVKDSDNKINLSELSLSLFDASLENVNYRHKWFTYAYSDSTLNNLYTEEYRIFGSIFNEISFKIEEEDFKHTKLRYYDEFYWNTKKNKKSFKYFSRYKDSGIRYEMSEPSFNEDLVNFDYRNKKSSKSENKLKENNREKEYSLRINEIKPRKDLKDTAFFYPNLITNENGEINISFKLPDNLTKWKLMGFAHTKDMKYGYMEKYFVTQKKLMVIPNLPRFFREGDTIYLSTKVINTSNKIQIGKIKLDIIDSESLINLDKIIIKDNLIKNIEIEPNNSISIKWKLKIPQDITAINCKIVAMTDDYSDGEESIVPILSNRMLVTETLPLSLRKNQTKKFLMKNLINNNSNTLEHYNYTFEYTNNPVWYAVQALPYLVEYPYNCSEQIFSKYYGNLISKKIINDNKEIKEIFNKWKNIETSNALLANLEKNGELKMLLLEETPWKFNSKNESERKKRLGILFDDERIEKELKYLAIDIKIRQNQDGGWPWFPGFESSWFVTQHIVAGFGHLKSMGINLDKSILESINTAIKYLDNNVEERYNSILRSSTNKEQRLEKLIIHYLYARTFFRKNILNGKKKEMFDYFINIVKSSWKEQSLYFKTMIALILFRNEEEELAKKIMISISEYALISEEFGMYWKENKRGYYWYNSPIEVQSMLIEAFETILPDNKRISEMKIWLLKQKQVQDWGTTKATADACFALLSRGENLLNNNTLPKIKIGNKKLNIKKLNKEDGTGYFKKSWAKKDIRNNMGKISIKNGDSLISWGSAYWQYFEDIDNITSSDNKMKCERELFLEKLEDNKSKLIPINENTKIKVGDRVIVQLNFKVDRDLEFVFLKDMRASTFEPEDKLSDFVWKNNLWFYKEIKDSTVNFFFDFLPKGYYTLEYNVRATNSGSFSNGIATLQCMYAPEFAAHSSGLRVNIE